MNKVGNVFFIQRAAIDVLLLNKATAIDICTYLIISKYTDRHGYESGVGYKTIKERLGVGQKKAREAIKRLLLMEISGQKLLHSRSDWLYKKTGSFPLDTHNFGWVRGWFESEYKHQVWLSNDLVGNNGDKEKPLNYFIKGSGRDNHARLMLLLYKYHNRQYSGVNYKFASITSQSNLTHTINGYDFYISRLGEHHVSKNILDKFGIYLTSKETNTIFNDLKNGNFINVSISVIDKHGGPDIPAKENKEKRRYKKRQFFSDKQLSAWEKIKANRLKYKDHFTTYTLTKITNHKNRKVFSIGLYKIYTKTPLKKFSRLAFAKLRDLPDEFSESDSKFIYRLDYKSDKKRNLPLDDCLAGTVEEIVQKCGLELASRKGKFYDTYWWFNPGVKDIRLVGVMMPAHIPSTKLQAYDKTLSALLELDNENVNQAKAIIKSNEPFSPFDIFEPPIE